MYNLVVDNMFYTDVGLLWSYDEDNARSYDIETANRIVNHWKKCNTLLCSMKCSEVVVFEVLGPLIVIDGVKMKRRQAESMMKKFKG